MPSPRVRKRLAGWLAGACVLFAAQTAALAQEFLTVVPVGEPPDTSYVRMAMMARPALRLPDAELLARLDAVKRAGATDVAVDIWDMGTVPYENSQLADSDTTLAGRDPLTVVSKGCYERGLRCWLWPSAGFEVWRTPLAAKNDPGPFLRGRPTWAAVNRDGQVGYVDSIAGVRRYTLSPTIRDVHQFLMKTFLEAIGRYPVAGVLLDRIELPSLDFSFDASSNALFQQQYDPVDPRGLTPADSMEWQDWWTFRNVQTRPFVSGFTKNLRRQSEGPTTAVVIHASPERRDHVQDLIYWNKRAAISWVLVRPTARTNADLVAAMDSTMRELVHSTPETRHAPGLGVLVDGGDLALAQRQVAALAAAGGRIVAVPEEAVSAAPEAWKALWSSVSAPAPKAVVTKSAAPAAKGGAKKPARPKAKGKK